MLNENKGVVWTAPYFYFYVNFGLSLDITAGRVYNNINASGVRLAAVFLAVQNWERLKMGPLPYKITEND